MNGIERERVLARRLVVVDRGGQVLRRVSREEAQALVQGGGAAFRPRRHGRISAVQLLAPDSHVYESSRPRAVQYSHDHETLENPRGVWTLVHLPDHWGPLFRAVVSECAA